MVPLSLIQPELLSHLCRWVGPRPVYFLHPVPGLVGDFQSILPLLLPDRGVIIFVIWILSVNHLKGWKKICK